jgi:hypothetical protein
MNSRTYDSANPSGCPQPYRGKRQRIVLDDQPTLRRSVGAGYPEVGHLPVTDLCLGEVIERQFAADPAPLGIDQDVQQAPAERLWGLRAWMFATGLEPACALLSDTFSHGG